MSSTTPQTSWERYRIVVFSPSGVKLSTTELMSKSHTDKILKELNKNTPKDMTITVETWKRTNYVSFVGEKE